MPQNNVYGIIGFHTGFFRGKGKCQCMQWAYAHVGELARVFLDFHEILYVFKGKKCCNTFLSYTLLLCCTCISYCSY